MSAQSFPLDDRLRRAYSQAMRQSHDGGRVEFHFGSDVVAYLRSLCTVEVPGWQPEPRAWGLPVVMSDDYPPDHISVHTVYTIH